MIIILVSYIQNGFGQACYTMSIGAHCLEARRLEREAPSSMAVQCKENVFPEGTERQAVLEKGLKVYTAHEILGSNTLYRVFRAQADWTLAVRSAVSCESP
jgi:hypothetical protein